MEVTGEGDETVQLQAPPLFGSACLAVSSALSKGSESFSAEAFAACPEGVRPPDHDATIPRP
jgi:hypothetical protein